VTLLLDELTQIETDSNFSISSLVSTLGATQGAMASQKELLGSNVAELNEELQKSIAARQENAASAEQREARLTAEVARLCGVVERLKVDAKKAAEDHAKMHADVVKTLTFQLMEKQSTIEERDAQIKLLEQKLESTSTSLTSELRELAREKELRESRLQEENREAAERSRFASAAFEERLASLQEAKDASEKQLSSTLDSFRQDASREQESLRQKIEKMRKLQELALGGVSSPGRGAASDASPSSGPADTLARRQAAAASGRARQTRGRQLLYYESLKHKGKEKSSISWRGDDVFAHELPLGSARETSPVKGESPLHTGQAAHKDAP
jgi:uncharacterized coiled-coil protein SlyX